MSQDRRHESEGACKTTPKAAHQCASHGGARSGRTVRFRKRVNSVSQRKPTACLSIMGMNKSLHSGTKRCTLKSFESTRKTFDSLQIVVDGLAVRFGHPEFENSLGQLEVENLVDGSPDSLISLGSRCCLPLSVFPLADLLGCNF